MNEQEKERHYKIALANCILANSDLDEMTLVHWTVFARHFAKMHAMELEPTKELIEQQFKAYNKTFEGELKLPDDLFNEKMLQPKGST